MSKIKNSSQYRSVGKENEILNLLPYVMQPHSSLRCLEMKTLWWSLTHFWPISLWYLLKTPKNGRFSCAFRGNQKVTLARNGLNVDIMFAFFQAFGFLASVGLGVQAGLHFFEFIRNKSSITIDCCCWKSNQLLCISV